MRPGIAIAVLGYLAATQPSWAAQDMLALLRGLVGGSALSVKEDARLLTMEWRCPGTNSEATYCIVASTQMYWGVFKGIRDKKLDVSERLLDFRTRMYRHSPEGVTDDIVLLAASWDGTQLMKTDWASTSIGSAIDAVTWVHADQSFPTSWALGEVCNSLYGSWPRFCELAKLSSRR